MPTNIRIMLSVVVAVVAFFVFYFVENGPELETLRWFSIALAVAMEMAIWLFPEARRGGD
jgi:hypothetical protein